MINVSAPENETEYDEDGVVIEKSVGPMPAPAAPPKGFNVFLAAIENGKTHDDLSKELQKLVGHLVDHQHKFGNKVVNGTITLKVALKLDQGVFSVSPEIKVSKPEEPRGRSIFWPTPENNLVESNPNQRKFDFGNQNR